MRADPNPCVTN